MSDLFGWFDKRNILQDVENQQQALGGDSSTSRGQVSCVSTKQCGSGFACIDGICEKLDTGSDQSGIDTAGDCNSGGGGGSSLCGSGSRACSDNASCGGSDPPTECCGQGVKFRIFNLETYKLETSCDEPGDCNPFCSASFAALGVMPTGCEGKDPCLSACEYCGLDFKRNGRFCQKSTITQTTPCYCDNGARCGHCESCDSNPGSSKYGQCYSTDQDRCQQCITKDNHYCCGKNVGPITACSGGGKTAKSVLRDMIAASCTETCDNCETSRYESYCSDSPNYDQMPDRDNLPNGTTQTGYLNFHSAGVECYFFKIEDRSNCEECSTTLECHCHDDCGPGQTCSDGVCTG